MTDVRFKDSMEFQRQKSVVEEDALRTEFVRVAVRADVKAVAILSTLVDELKKSDLDHFWSLAKNTLIIVQITICLMPTSTSAEHSFPS